MTLPVRLRELRNASGQSLQQVAEKVGTSKAYLSELERGVANNPGIEVLRALADAYGISVSALLGETAGPALPPPVGAQVEGWISQIRKENAAGLDIDTAAREARESFERLMGPLNPQQEANWKAAHEQLSTAFEKEIEYLASHSIRKPRRPHWYDGPKVTDRHWPALESFLLTRKGWDDDTVTSINRTSTEVVSLMENPAQTSFKGRGMVVGYVQSGKTANMAAVIAKAVDAGYRFVIILTGMTNSLRAQTQDRMQGDLLERNKYEWYPHTTSEVDFKTPASSWFAAMDPVQFAAVKKNVSPLKALLNTIRKTSRTLRERMPVLIIDDECDQAGVNASGSQFNMTAINGYIRKILAELPKVQYVGYTATPFANVLINPETPAGGLDDLYPEDFITSLPLPDGYFGPEKSLRAGTDQRGRGDGRGERPRHGPRSSRRRGAERPACQKGPGDLRADNSVLAGQGPFILRAGDGLPVLSRPGRKAQLDAGAHYRLHRTPSRDRRRGAALAVQAAEEGRVRRSGDDRRAEGALGRGERPSRLRALRPCSRSLQCSRCFPQARARRHRGCGGEQQQLDPPRLRFGSEEVCRGWWLGLGARPDDRGTAGQLLRAHHRPV